MTSATVAGWNLLKLMDLQTAERVVVLCKATGATEQERDARDDDGRSLHAAPSFSRN